MYSLRNGAPLKERNKIKFHRSLRGEGGVLEKLVWPRNGHTDGVDNI